MEDAEAEGYDGTLGELTARYRRLVDDLDRRRDMLPLQLQASFRDPIANAELDALRLKIMALIPNGPASRRVAEARRSAEVRLYRLSPPRRQRSA